MSLSAWLVLAPALAAMVGLAAGRGVRAAAAPVAVLGATAATVLAAVQAVSVAGAGRSRVDVFAHVPTGGPVVEVGLRVDALAASTTLMVCVVALLVQVYSVAYLAGDPRYPSYAAFVSLFTAAMLLVVLADDLLVLYVGWEVMGLCSYVLIGHHWELETARAAAVKAFLTTRVGDAGLLVGILVLGSTAGSFQISSVLAAVTSMSVAKVTLCTLLVLLGVVGKSAQFPLHTWLPDAMAGPTPISALIHAATMVAAGVYLVLVLYPAFLLAPATLTVLAVVACVSMLGAALAALAQEDIKRVLAYSTVSQLAYMFGALAVGGREAGAFHLLSHAAFKALLFLAAGSLIHAVGSNDLSEMGGLRRAMPLTFVTTTCGLAALVGIPPAAGFFSKESVLGAAADAAGNASGVLRTDGWLVLVTGMVTVAVTAAYATRVWLRAFFGQAPEHAGERSEQSHGHEPPAAMRWPLAVLAVPSVLLGLLGLRRTWLGTWVGGDVSGQAVALTPSLATTALALLLTAAGAALAWRSWQLGRDSADLLGAARSAAVSGFGVDRLYEVTVVRPVLALARAVRWNDDEVVDGYVQGSGVLARTLGSVVRRSQAGNVQTYLTALVAGSLVLAVVMVVAT